MTAASITGNKLRVATAAEVRTRGAGMTLEAGFAASPFGECLIARCSHGFCHLGFPAETTAAQALAEMHARWPLAAVERDDALAAVWSEMVFSAARDARPRLPLFVAATPFQSAVWNALLCVPRGSVIHYAALAEAAGHPLAYRATGTAVGANPLAWLIPCHRVIRADGQTGNFRWGTHRKRAMLDWEAACPA